MRLTFQLLQEGGLGEMEEGLKLHFDSVLEYASVLQSSKTTISSDVSQSYHPDEFASEVIKCVSSMTAFEVSKLLWRGKYTSVAPPILLWAHATDQSDCIINSAIDSMAKLIIIIMVSLHSFSLFY